MYDVILEKEGWGEFVNELVYRSSGHLSFLSIAFPNLLNTNARMIMNLIINRWKKKKKRKKISTIHISVLI